MSRRIVRSLMLACLPLGTLWAGTDPFVGKWKLNVSRSHLADQMKVEAAGPNKYSFNFGGGVETVVADGTDQPGVAGTSLSVNLEDPETLKVVRKKEGRMLLTATWKLSRDGRTLHDAFTEFQPDGSASSTVDLRYERTAGTSGFPGTWERSAKPDSAFELEVRPYEGGGLSFVRPVPGTTRNVRFDGSELANPSVIQGLTTAGHRVDEHTLQLTDKIDGKPLDTQKLSVARDGKTLTMTIHRNGLTKPSVLVFDRE